MSPYDHLKKLIEQHKRNLQEFEKQRASFSSQAPLHIINGIKHEEDEIKRIEAELNKNYQGSQIIELLTKLDREALLENLQSLYETVREEVMTTVTNDTIRQCERALEWLEESTEYDAPYSRARFNMLLGAIYLNNEKKRLILATDYFRDSRDQFRKRKSYLESVAELGLAFAQDEMGDLEGAISSLDRAKQIAYRESTIPPLIKETDLDDLRRIIKEQNAKTLEKIQAKESRIKTQIKDVEKLLPIFTISSSEHCIGRGGTTDLNLLSLEDYRYHNVQSSENVIVDLRKRRGFRRADYILEIDGGVNQVNDGLGKGDWLLIESKENPRELRGKLVAVLLRHVSEAGVERSASLKTFSQAGDHYFLNALNKCKSVLITHYQSGDVSKISSYYKGYTEVEVIPAFDVRVTGEVVDRIPHESAEKIKPNYIWEVPIISEVPDDPSSQIAEEDVIEIIPVRKHERQKGHNYFGLKEENQRDDRSESDRYILICQQQEIKDKELAAVVIEHPDTHEKLRGLRLCRLYEQCNDKRHLYLQAVKRSGKEFVVDTSGEHLVVIAEGADINAIKGLYAKVRSGQKLIFCDRTAVTIIGKYIETIEKKKN